jgi:hypothetical protein
MKFVSRSRVLQAAVGADGSCHVRRRASTSV